MSRYFAIQATFAEIPGVLETGTIRKIDRRYPFNDACQWFIDHADLIILVYDYAKLDIGPETEALLDRTLANGGKGRRKEDPDLIAAECGMGELADNQAVGLEDHPIAGQHATAHRARSLLRAPSSPPGGGR